MSRAALGLALALVFGFILYGSLFPFRFAPPPGDALEAIRDALRPRPPASRGDVLANLALYAPVGALLAPLLPARLGAALRLALAALAGLLLSAGIEAAQVFLPARHANPWDVALNTAGTLAGGAVALWLGREGWHAPGLAAGARREPFVALLLLAWLGERLYPYVPALDWQAWKDALKPLLLTPVLEPARSFRLAVAWLVFAWLLARLAAPARWPAPLAVLGAVAAEVPILERRLDAAEVLGAGLGLAAWLALPARGRGVAALLALLLLAAVAIERLEPFAFAAEARPFGWIPFRSVMSGHWAQGMQALLHKAFLYGALLWLAVRAGLALPLAAALGTLLLLAAGMAQTHLPGRSGEITDAALLLLLALVMALLPGASPPPRAAAGGAGPARSSPPPRAP